MTRPATPSRSKRLVFTVLTLGVGVAGAGGLLLGYHGWRSRPSGQALNRMAWEASFAERGAPVPASGPRDGYWGARLPPWVRDPEIGWHEAEAHLPGLVEEDATGLQTLARPGAARHLLILGGSVAWGAYASGLDATYFARLARALEAQALPVTVTVLAAGAWTSEHELRALRARGLALEPDAVLLLTGLNDLTQARDVPEEARVARFLRNVGQARDLCAARGVPLIVALQPSILAKSRTSALESRILDLSLDSTLPEPLLRRSWKRMQDGLASLSRQGPVRFHDCSDAFRAEAATTFTDLWHFADAGHALLADCLAAGVAPALAARSAASPIAPAPSGPGHGEVVSGPQAVRVPVPGFQP